MCGFFGIISLKKSDSLIDEKRAIGATEYIKMRGPDFFDSKAGPDFFLAHSRLSIVDLSEAAKQPMSDKDERYIIVFNGEIYNYKEIRKQLESKGVVFTTKSDTEVLLQVLIYWGESGLEKLNGIFSFAFFDRYLKKIILVRDPVGVKPLYYCINNSTLVFASSMFPIIFYNKLNEKPTLTSICSFLSFRTTLGENTLLPSIKKLLPGQLLTLDTKEINTRKYSDLIADYVPNSSTFSLETLQKAVHMQRSDSSMGSAVLLSGGLDSSILSYELNQHNDAPLNCYTAKVEGAMYDESYYAQLAASNIDSQLNTVDINNFPDIEMLNEIIKSRQSPLGMHNEVGMFQLAKEVSKNQKIMFTGEGADELFAGYSRIFRFDFDYKRAINLKDNPNLCNELDLIDIEVGHPLKSFLGRYSYFPLEEQSKLLIQPHLASITSDVNEYFFNYFESIQKRSAGKDLFSLVTSVFVDFHLPSLLEMVDGTSMANGVEARVPFTDIELVKMALSMDPKEKIRWRSPADKLYAEMHTIRDFSEKADITKWALRHAYKNKLPPQILDRKKMGFPSPLGNWVSSPSVLDILQRIFNNDAHINEWFDNKKLHDWYKQESIHCSDTFGHRLWLLINLELFLSQIYQIANK